jgi:hypothetical protein
MDRGPRYSNFAEGRLAFADRPTISFAPQRSPELTKGLLSRIPLDTLYLFVGTAEGVERHLRLFVRNLNGLDNCGGTGPHSPRAPEFHEFRSVAGLIDELQKQRQLVLAVEQREVEVPDPVPLDSHGMPDLAKIKAAGLNVRSRGEKQGHVLTHTKAVHVLRFQHEVLACPEVLELVRLLRLEPGHDSYDVEELIQGQFRPSDSDGQRTRIDVTMRSVLEVMFFLSQAVNVPPEHICSGLVVETQNPDGSPFDWDAVLGDLFHIRVTRHKPKSAFLAVQYRGYWFYIDDADTTSKITLTLFNDLFRLQRIGAAEGQPLLTLPVGR